MSETPAHHYSQKKPKGKTTPGPRMPLLPPQDFADNERPLPANSNSTVGVFEQKMEANMGHLDEELQKNPEMDVERVRAAVVLESMFEALGDLRSSFLLSPKVTNEDGSPKDKRFLYAIQAPDGQWFYPETSGITVGYQYTDQMRIGSDDGMVYFRAMFPAVAVPGGDSLPLSFRGRTWKQNCVRQCENQSEGRGSRELAELGATSLVQRFRSKTGRRSSRTFLSSGPPRN